MRRPASPDPAAASAAAAPSLPSRQAEARRTVGRRGRAGDRHADRWCPFRFPALRSIIFSQRPRPLPESDSERTPPRSHQHRLVWRSGLRRRLRVAASPEVELRGVGHLLERAGALLQRLDTSAIHASASRRCRAWRWKGTSSSAIRGLGHHDEVLLRWRACRGLNF